MTDATRRLTIVAVAILVLFLSWAFIAARPWAVRAATPPDPRWRALAQREARLRHDAVLVRRVVNRRWRHYRVALHRRELAISHARTNHRHALAAAASAQRAAAQAAAAQSYAPSPSYSGSSSAPSVRVVTLPPLTITRTS
jgi:hypothetical protein